MSGPPVAARLVHPWVRPPAPRWVSWQGWPGFAPFRARSGDRTSTPSDHADTAGTADTADDRDDAHAPHRQERGPRGSGGRTRRHDGTTDGRLSGGGGLTAVLAVGTLGSTPVSATTTPGAPAMPRGADARQGHRAGLPVALGAGLRRPDPGGSARVQAQDGGTDQRFNVPTPPGSTLLWGDWNRDGAFTPAVFTNGHWVVYDAMIGLAPTPSREFDFGMAGDKPVAGDFNKDGRTDVGVVRGNLWLLRSFPSAGPTWRRIRLRLGHRPARHR